MKANEALDAVLAALPAHRQDLTLIEALDKAIGLPSLQRMNFKTSEIAWQTLLCVCIFAYLYMFAQLHAAPMTGPLEMF